jgi:hypothetical protein
VDKVIYSNSLAGSQTFFDQINTLTDKEIAGYFDEELKTTKQEEQEEGDVPEGIARNIVRDAEQNTYYLNQLLLKIEKEVITISSFLSFLKLGIIAIKGYFLFAEFIIGLYSKDSPKQATRGTSIQTNDLLRNSVQTSLILIEILVIKYYVSSTSHHTDKEDEPKKLSKFVVMLIAKIEYYAKFSTVKLQEHITERKIKKQKDKAQSKSRLTSRTRPRRTKRLKLLRPHQSPESAFQRTRRKPRGQEFLLSEKIRHVARLKVQDRKDQGRHRGDMDQRKENLLRGAESKKKQLFCIADGV